MIDFPHVAESQISELEGKPMTVGKQQFRFGPSQEGGGQAYAVPLLNENGTKAAYFRILKPLVVSTAYLHRQQWMVGQKLHRMGRVFAAAPQMFWSTKQHGRPSGVSFDFVGTIHGLAKGISWNDWKSKCVMAEALAALGKPFIGEPTPHERVAFAKSLIQALANLECLGKNGFVHGDLSDANIMLDQETKEVNLIDFDAFVFDSPTLKYPRLTTGQLGSKGTRGYIPDWHFRSKSLDASPLGDRFARDILLIELLGFCKIDPEEISPLYWKEVDQVQARISDLANSLGLQHLTQQSVFELSEAKRPSSVALAENLNLKIRNNVRTRLDAPPVKLFQSISVPSDPSDQNQKADSDAATRWEAAIRSLDWQTLGRLTLIGIDRGVQKIGDVAIEFLKAASIWMLGIAGVVVWVWTIVAILMKVNFPASLILAGLVFSFPIWYYSTRFSNNDKSS